MNLTTVANRLTHSEWGLLRLDEDSDAGPQLVAVAKAVARTWVKTFQRVDDLADGSALDLDRFSALRQVAQQRRNPYVDCLSCHGLIRCRRKSRSGRPGSQF